MTSGGGVSLSARTVSGRCFEKQSCSRDHEVSTIRVSGWIKHSTNKDPDIFGVSLGPPAHAGGTDRITVVEHLRQLKLANEATFIDRAHTVVMNQEHKSGYLN
jgi:hypothetical protein